MTHVSPTNAAGAIALLAIGIDRSWELVGGRSTGVSGMITDLVVEHDQRRTESEARTAPVDSGENPS